MLGVPAWQRDAAPNDSDKSFTVPEWKAWRLESVFWELVASGTAGNRAVVIEIKDSGGSTIYLGPAISYISASVTGRGTAFPGNALSTATVTAQQFPLIRALLPAGCMVRVYDSASIDAAADDLTVALHYVELNAEDFL